MTVSNIAVIGAGAWGTTIAAMLAGKGLQARLWVRESELAEIIKLKHENSLFLSGIPLPSELIATPCFSEATAGADLVILSVPSRWMRAICRELSPHLTSSFPIITVTKGLEIETGKRMSEVIREEIPTLTAIGALSGPNLALEIAQKKPAATVIASEDVKLAEWAQELFMTPYFRAYRSKDIIGVEVCGAVKNVITIAVGICEGLGYGDNARAALLTRAVAEISRLVHCLGGCMETVAGLSGIGDLIATCASPISRNHRIGLAVGRGENYASALGNSGQVAEGIPTTEAVVRLARRLNVELPICEQVYAMLFQGQSADEAVKTLMSRGRRWEND